MLGSTGATLLYFCRARIFRPPQYITAAQNEAARTRGRLAFCMEAKCCASTSCHVDKQPATLGTCTCPEGNRRVQATVVRKMAPIDGVSVVPRDMDARTLGSLSFGRTVRTTQSPPIILLRITVQSFRSPIATPPLGRANRSPDLIVGSALVLVSVLCIFTAVKLLPADLRSVF